MAIISFSVGKNSHAVQVSNGFLFPLFASVAVCFPLSPSLPLPVLICVSVFAQRQEQPGGPLLHKLCLLMTSSVLVTTSAAYCVFPRMLLAIQTSAVHQIFEPFFLSITFLFLVWFICIYCFSDLVKQTAFVSKCGKLSFHKLNEKEEQTVLFWYKTLCCYCKPTQTYVILAVEQIRKQC